MTKQVSQPETGSTYPSSIDNGALRALYDNLEGAGVLVGQEPPPPHYGEDRGERALAVDRAIRAVKKADWRGNRFKEREVRNAIRAELGGDEALVDTVFAIVKAQREY